MNSLQVAPLSYVRDLRPDQNIKLPAGLTARLAMDYKTKNDAYALRHASYLAGKHIDPKPNGLFSDLHDEMPNCQSLVVYRKLQPIASARICILDTSPEVNGWCDIPAVRIFPEEVAAMLASGSKVSKQPVKALEINRLVRHPDFADDFTLVFILFRLAGFMIIHHDTDFVLSCVRQNHTPFYKRLKFQKIAGPKRYAGVKFETNLMACPRQSYDEVQNLQIFESITAKSNDYNGLFRGEAVSVFGA